VTRSGETVWAEVVSFVIQYGGRPAVLVKVYDVTERKRAEEQLMHSSRLAELGEMAASVAHELNQPLTGIRNWAKNAAYMIENAVGDSSEVAENLALISEQVDRASKIINQMRDLTRRADQDLQLLDIDSVVRQAVDFLDHQFKLSGIEVALDLAEDLPDVIGVRVRLEQVFLNIMTNARQSMEEVEDRRLTVRTGAEGQEVIVEIADTGKGFSPADRDRIFAPFYSTKKPGHGTGLGLSISESIVEQHGGRIEASSEEGAGARFIVRLPAAREGQRPEED